MKERFTSEELKTQAKEELLSVGVDLEEKARAGSFLQRDDKILLSRSLSEGVEIFPIEKALEDIAEAKNYYGEAFRVLDKEFFSQTQGGCFIRIKKGRKVEFPIQACLFLSAKRFNQKVHNLIIVEEGASLYLITGCVASKSAEEASHSGVSEFFVKKGGYLNFTMIHSWREDISVRPISIAVLEEGACFVSNYICLKPVKEIVMYPTAVAQGESCRVSFSSLILSYPGSFQDIGSRVIFRKRSSSAEIISRAVSLGGSAILRGHLKAQAENIKAHLECRGLIINQKGKIQAIPELETEFRDVDLSHEAAIGKISKEEIEYLCSRGFSHKEAQSLIIRGFMDVDILGLPQILKEEIKRLEEKILEGF